jgi:arylsulfatase A-like enzyme
MSHGAAINQLLCESARFSPSSSPPLIERERLTVSSLLKQQGHHTAAFGKWHLSMNWNLPPEFTKSEKAIPSGTLVTDGPITRGFDVLSGYTHARTIGMVMEQDRVAMNVEPVEVQPLLTKKAVASIEERAKASARASGQRVKNRCFSSTEGWWTT